MGNCFHCSSKEIEPKCHPVIANALEFVESVAGHNRQHPCLFSDALDLIPYGTFNPSWTYSKKLKAVSGAVPATRTQCLAHGGVCLNSGRDVDFAVSGLPCPDMSAAGLRRKRAGETSNVYLAHGSWTTRNRIPLLLVECTPETCP